MDFPLKRGEPCTELIEWVGRDSAGGKHFRGSVCLVGDNLDLVGVGVQIFLGGGYGVHLGEFEEMVKTRFFIDGVSESSGTDWPRTRESIHGADSMAPHPLCHTRPVIPGSADKAFLSVAITKLVPMAACDHAYMMHDE